MAVKSKRSRELSRRAAASSATAPVQAEKVTPQEPKAFWCELQYGKVLWFKATPEGKIRVHEAAVPPHLVQMAASLVGSGS